VLTAHVLLSVGWLGLAGCLIVLAVALTVLSVYKPWGRTRRGRFS
jgi:hypothetical protein